MFARLLIVTFRGSVSKGAAGAVTARPLLRTTLELVVRTSQFISFQNTAWRHARLGRAAVVDLVTRIDISTIANFVPLFNLKNRVNSVAEESSMFNFKLLT